MIFHLPQSCFRHLTYIVILHNQDILLNTKLFGFVIALFELDRVLGSLVAHVSFSVFILRRNLGLKFIR